jgi:hypothetical protein
MHESIPIIFIFCLYNVKCDGNRVAAAEFSTNAKIL